MLNANIKRITWARFLSLMGNGIFSIAVPLYILRTTGSLFDVGLYFTLIRVPAILLTLPMGVLVEKVNRKSSMILCDLSSALLFGILAVGLLFGLSNVIFLGIISGIYEIVSNFFALSSSVLFSEVTIEEDRLKANGYKSVFENICYLASPVIGMFLFAQFGMICVVCVNLFSFIISSIIEGFIDYRYQKEKAAEEEHKKLSLIDYKEVFQFLKKNVGILGLLVVIMFLNFFVAPNEEVVFPGIVLQKYKIGEVLYGFSSTAFVFGSLIISAVILKTNIMLKIRLKTLFVVNSILLATIGILSLCLYSFHHILFFVFFTMLMIIIGGITTMVNIPLMSEFQTRVPIKIQGRFFAGLTLGSDLLVPIGTLYAGFMSEYIGADKLLIFSNIIVIAIVFIFIKSSQMTKKGNAFEVLSD